MPTFQQTFANCPFPEGVLAVLGSFPAQVRVLKAQRAMEVAVSGTNVSRETLAQAEECLKRAFGLSTATVDVNEPEPAAPAGVEQPPAPEPDSSQSAPELSVPAPPGDLEAQMAAMRRKLLRADTPAAGKGKKKVRQIYGKISGKKKPVPMNELTLDMGSVLVEGEVFNVEHRELTRRKAWVVCFDLTDLTSSIRITRFMEGEEAKPIIDQVKKNQRLQVQGRLTLGRFDNNDLVMEPYGINEVPKPEGRQDTAPDKRVELHLHTKMSTMDALCDTKAVVKRAIEWGHPAIAITDHGVVQSFPDAYSASGRGEKIKVLYGVEAYYQNDVDEQAAVHGPGDMPLDGEFVAFDLETTGLDARADAIIEIGAVRVRGGEVVDKFASFAQPGRPLSAKTVALTGITDEMLKGAPAPEEAVDTFLDWVGDTPLCAHNAAFDTGFIREYCFRAGRRFDPLYFDTLILAQYLCPKLPNHKLDTVASALGLPPFQHHRAYDDAETCGLILAALVPLLREQGVERAAQINRVFAGKKRGGRGRRSAFHLIVLAKNQIGLRNLYKLVSKAHLEHFNRYPIMPKSLIDENREGLIIGSACEAGELFQAVAAGREDRELERIAAWYDYLEIQPLSNNAYMLRPNKEGRSIARDWEDLRNFNRRVVDLGERLGKPVCATGDVHFMEPTDEVYRHVLLAAKEFEDADQPNPLYFRTTDEMLEEFSYLGAEKAREVVVDSPRLIADWCDNVRPLPDGLFAPKLENSDGELKDLVWGKAKRLYGEEPPQIVVDRINAELVDIIRCKYDVIYMSAQKLVQNSLEHGYLVGSRGSV